MKDTYKVPERLIDELIEVRPGVLVLQLNGTGHIESVQQLARLMEERIEQTNSSVVVFDLTNTQDIDGATAYYVTEIISLVQKLGLQVILADGHSSIHKEAMHLGVDLSGIKIVNKELFESMSGV